MPTVVFCFSRKRVEMMADYFTAKDFMSAAEKSSVHRFCEQALERLKPADRRLPQIARLRSMLGRGMAVHHAGECPWVLETSPCECISKILESFRKKGWNVMKVAADCAAQGHAGPRHGCAPCM